MCTFCAKGTSITKQFDPGSQDASLTKWIKFVDVGMGEGTLDQYLLGRQTHSGHIAALTPKFRPIGTSDNEVCLFPISATTRLCAVVASLFAKSLTTHSTDATPLLDTSLLNRNQRQNDEEADAPLPRSILEGATSAGRRNSLRRSQRLPSTDQRDVGGPPAFDFDVGADDDLVATAEQIKSPMMLGQQQRQRQLREQHLQMLRRRSSSFAGHRPR